MRNSVKYIALLLALTALLSGCNSGEPAATTAATTTTTEPAVTEPAPAPIDSEEALLAALEKGGRVVLEGDIEATQVIPVTDDIFDGAGHTITGPQLQQVEVETEDGKEMQNVVETENAVMLTGGTVQNLNIQGAYRCLGDCKAYPMNNDVRIKNVNAEGTLYALSVGRGSGKAALYAENCTFRGWVNVNKLKEIRFTNCTFGYNAEGKNGYFRTYRNAELIGCHFESHVDANGKKTPYNISFNKSTSGVTLVLEDCYVDGVLVTQDNLTKLLKVKAYENTIIIRNTVS